MKQAEYKYTGNLFDETHNCFVAPSWIERAYKGKILYYEDGHLIFDNGIGNKYEVKKGDRLIYRFKDGIIRLCGKTEVWEGKQ